MNNYLILDKSEDSTDNPNEVCKGLVYRCKINIFVNSNGDFVESTRLRPMKRMSCSGCEHCDWIEEALKEQFSNGKGYFDGDELEHGVLYCATVTDYSRDYETGYVDDYTIGFKRLETK